MVLLGCFGMKFGVTGYDIWKFGILGIFFDMVKSLVVP